MVAVYERGPGHTRPSICTPRASNSSFNLAKAPSSVVQTGVKSAGWEKRMVHLPLRNSWNLILPCVVCASKSGATDPILRRGCSAGTVRPRRNGVTAGRWTRNAGRAAERRAREAARGMKADIANLMVCQWPVKFRSRCFACDGCHNY